MLSDFEMVVHQIEENDMIKIVPVSDVHLGALEHNAEAWAHFRDSILNEPNTYIVLVGDLVNNSTRSSVANPFDEVIRPRDQKKYMVEQLMPLRDKILCAVSGNHEGRSIKDDDIDITYDIMSKLDIEHLYRTNAAFLKVSLGSRGQFTNGRNKPETTFVFVVTHGSGGGILTGASVNKNERFAGIFEGVDCLITGHTHKGVITRPQKIVVNSDKNRITRKPFVLVTAESWLDYGGYALSKMLTPAESSNPQTIVIGGTRNNKIIRTIW